MASTHRAADAGSKGGRSSKPESAPLPWAVFVVATLGAAGAAAAGKAVPGILGSLLAGVVAALAGAVALVFAKLSGDTREARVRRDENQLDEVRKTWGAAVVELEKTRHQIDLATNSLRAGVDPLSEVPELRVGPLHDLLEAARVAEAPAASRPPLDETELVGAEPERTGPWPAEEPPRPAPFDTRQRVETLRSLDELILALESLAERMGPGAVSGQPRAAAEDVAPGARADRVSGERASGDRTPAQLVDGVVQTAADGIEDLAAGLMRASELASVAERVTNRATLLALNAQLEATRSGGEAFGAIAEETRKLAEFAREATDTISQLAAEIEFKVGETITAIHTTSEDAKAALDSLSGEWSPAIPTPRGNPDVDPAFLDALLEQALSIRAALASGVATPEPSLPRPAPEPAVPQRAPEPERADLELRPAMDAGADLEAEVFRAEEPPVFRHDESEPTPPEHLLLLERLQPAPERRD